VAGRTCTATPRPAPVAAVVEALKLHLRPSRAQCARPAHKRVNVPRPRAVLRSSARFLFASRCRRPRLRSACVRCCAMSTVKRVGCYELGRTLGEGTFAKARPEHLPAPPARAAGTPGDSVLAPACRGVAAAALGGACLGLFGG
jgi:hypothetical protein